MTDQPNLLFVFADQLRLQSCGYAAEGGTYAGEPAPVTPAMDRLATESVDFRNAVAVNPVCAPYRASLFTGKYPSSTGMVVNELRAMPDPDAIAHVLHRHGYQTGYIGKWHLYGKDHSPRQQFVPPGPHRLGFDHTWKTYNFNHDYYDGFYFEDSFERQDVEGYQPRSITNLATDYLQKVSESGAGPFALFVSYGPPHDPWTSDNCPDSFLQLFDGDHFPDPPNYSDGHARYWHPEWDEQWWLDEWKPQRFRQRRIYAAQTASLDAELGRLIGALNRLDLSDDTIVVFTSDHGEMFGAHGRIAKKIFYEEAARVPFLVRWPGELSPQVSDACLNTPDIAPTLLSLMGLPVPDSMEGMDLSAVARGDHGPEPEAAFMQGMGHTFKWHNGDEWRAVRSRRYTYARMLADDSEYLFDHREDPYQLHNLIGEESHRAVHRTLRNYMQGRMEELNDPFKPTTWYRDHWIEDRVIVRSATRELEPEYRPS